MCYSSDGENILPRVLDLEDRIVAQFVEHDLLNMTNLHTCYRDMSEIMRECRTPKPMDPGKQYVYVANPYERRDANVILHTEDVSSFVQKLQELIDITGDPLIILTSNDV